MKYYSMKNTYLVVCGMLACFTSCSTDSDMLADGAGDNIGKVESVKFEIKTEWKEPPASNRSGEDIFTDENVSDLLLDAFIVQKKIMTIGCCLTMRINGWGMPVRVTSYQRIWNWGSIIFLC